MSAAVVLESQRPLRLQDSSTAQSGPEVRGLRQYVKGIIFTCPY